MFLSIDVFCLACLEDSSPILCYHVSCAHRFATTTSVQRESQIAQMQRICSFTDFYSMHLDYVRHWRMDFYGFSLRLRQSRADRRNEIPYKSKNKRNP